MNLSEPTPSTRLRLCFPMQPRTGSSETLFNEAVDSFAANMLAYSQQADFLPQIRFIHNGLSHPKQNALQKLGKTITVFMKEGDTWTHYHGACIGSGQWKETFLLHCPGATWHQRVMKITLLQWKSLDSSTRDGNYNYEMEKLDVEPQVFRKARDQGVTCQIFGDYIALDQNGLRYHSWLTEEAIPLRNLMTLHCVDHEQVLIGYMYILLKLCEKKHLYIKDCSTANLGVRLINVDASSDSEINEPVVIDGGHLNISSSHEHHRSKTNAVMRALWKLTAGTAPLATKSMENEWKTVSDINQFLQALQVRWFKKPWMTCPSLTAQQMKLALAHRGQQSRDVHDLEGADCEAQHKTISQDVIAGGYKKECPEKSQSQKEPAEAEKETGVHMRSAALYAESKIVQEESKSKGACPKAKCLKAQCSSRIAQKRSASRHQESTPHEKAKPMIVDQRSESDEAVESQKSATAIVSAHQNRHRALPSDWGTPRSKCLRRTPEPWGRSPLARPQTAKRSKHKTHAQGDAMQEMIAAQLDRLPTHGIPSRADLEQAFRETVLANEDSNSEKDIIDAFHWLLQNIDCSR